MSNEKTAFYPGSFDPITYGHVDVIERASGLFDRLIVGVGENRGKTPVFPQERRKAHLIDATAHLTNTEIVVFSRLLMDAAQEYNATAIIRGLRAVSDFETEFQMALMNQKLNPTCETIFLMPSTDYSFLSSTLICEIASLGGDVSTFVPPEVAEELKEYLAAE